MKQELRIPVDGGDLAVAVWGDPEAPPVLAVHGITSSHLAWVALAREMPGVQIIAPDLRGRGRSRDLPGPYGLRQHADDLQRVLAHLGVERLPVVGHSMGAFVSVLLAARAPGSVGPLVLVDGGLPLARPAGVSDAELPMRVLGPAAERLAMTFPDRAAYRAFWHEHPAFRRAWSTDIEDYADYDLVHDEGMLRPASVFDAVAVDALELYGTHWYLAALRALRSPVTVLRAPRGLLDETPGLYPPGALEGAASLVPHLTVVEVDDVNHYTVLMSAAGAFEVAAVVRDALSSAASTPQAKEPA